MLVERLKGKSYLNSPHCQIFWSQQEDIPVTPLNIFFDYFVLYCFIILAGQYIAKVLSTMSCHELHKSSASDSDTHFDITSCSRLRLPPSCSYHWGRSRSPVSACDPPSTGTGRLLASVRKGTTWSSAASGPPRRHVLSCSSLAAVVFLPVHLAFPPPCSTPAQHNPCARY